MAAELVAHLGSEQLPHTIATVLCSKGVTSDDKEGSGIPLISFSHPPLVDILLAMCDPNLQKTKSADYPVPEKKLHADVLYTALAHIP